MTREQQQQLFPVAPREPKLGSNQRDVLARIDRFGGVRIREAGRIVYRNRGVRDLTRLPKDWLDSAGIRVLISLRRRGLIWSAYDGVWKRRRGRS